MINGKVVKRRRLELKLSQTALAEQCGYSNRSTICTMEKGGSEDIPFSKAILLAKVLKINIEELWI